jgi:hypothetical protein
MLEGAGDFVDLSRAGGASRRSVDVDGRTAHVVGVEETVGVVCMRHFDTSAMGENGDKVNGGRLYRPQVPRMAQWDLPQDRHFWGRRERDGVVEFKNDRRLQRSGLVEAS